MNMEKPTTNGDMVIIPTLGIICNKENITTLMIKPFIRERTGFTEEGFPMVTSSKQLVFDVAAVVEVDAALKESLDDIAANESALPEGTQLTVSEENEGRITATIYVETVSTVLIDSATHSIHKHPLYVAMANASSRNEAVLTTRLDKMNTAWSVMHDTSPAMPNLDDVDEAGDLDEDNLTPASRVHAEYAEAASASASAKQERKERAAEEFEDHREWFAEKVFKLNEESDDEDEPELTATTIAALLADKTIELGQLGSLLAECSDAVYITFTA